MRIYFISLLLFMMLSKSVFSQDISLASLNLNGYAGLSSTIYCVVNNNGGFVSEFKVSFSVDGGTIITETFYTSNISSPQRWWFPLSSPAVFSSAGSHTLKVWTSLPNGTADSNPANDSINQTLTVLQYAPQKMVMIDRFVGEWGGYCPDGDIKSQQIADLYSNQVLQVAYHNTDPMAIPEGGFLEDFFGNNGFPMGMIDRFEFSWLPGESQDRMNWLTQTDERLKYVVPADVALSDYSFDSVTHNFSVKVTANFYGAADDNFQLDLVITEDSIISQGQHNYYNIPGAVNPDQPLLNNIGDPILNYAHMHVARDILNAPSATIPFTIPSSGGTYSYTFTGTLNSSWNEQHVRYIGMLHRNTGFPDQAEVVNCSALETDCSADFSLVADSAVAPHYWAVNAATGAQPLSYIWSWGDGSYDSTAYPSHTYAAAGYYTICLSIQNSTGCFDSICIPYNVQKMTAGNTIVTVDVVDSIPATFTSVENNGPLQSWSIFPNPASPNPSVNYSLSTPSSVNIKVYNVLGKELQQVVNEDQEAGKHQAGIDTEKLAAGIYFLQIRLNNQVESKKMMVLR
jgi:hypothetical protein